MNDQKEPEPIDPLSTNQTLGTTTAGDDLEVGILYLECNEALRRVKDNTSLKILIGGLMVGAKNATGAIPPVMLLRKIKETLTHLEEFEKKVKNDENKE